MDMSNCITCDITTCNNENMAMKSAYLCFLMVSLIFDIFINTCIHKYAKYANKQLCVS